MNRVAFFPGSFDPMTLGHVGVLTAALGLADRVVIGVGVNAGKAPLFSAAERVAMLRDVAAGLPDGLGSRVEVVAFDGLLIDAARAAGATTIVRGVRDASDADAELRMAAMNAALAPDLQTVLIPAAAGHRAISATLVRQIAAMKGDISAFVPAPVLKRFARRGAAQTRPRRSPSRRSR